jgi:hypothetical protein
MKKKYFKNYFLIIFFIIFFVIFFTNFTKKNTNNVLDKVQYENQDTHNSNIIDSISYSSKDLKGNEYKIFAKKGEIDLVDSDIIYLTDVKAQIILNKKPDIITITSNYGKYNILNYSTIFSKNVKINYIDNVITGDYMDYSMINNLLIISKNVVYNNFENVLSADVIELDTITKDTKIFMHHSKDKVKIKNFN